FQRRRNDPVLSNVSASPIQYDRKRVAEQHDRLHAFEPLRRRLLGQRFAADQRQRCEQHLLQLWLRRGGHLSRERRSERRLEAGLRLSQPPMLGGRNTGAARTLLWTARVCAADVRHAAELAAQLLIITTRERAI